MPNRSLKTSLLSNTLALCAVLLFAVTGAAAELAPQSSRAGGVSVSVKPTDVSAGATVWQFRVALNTHSGDLGDDLARTAVILDGAGKQHPAVAWDGDPAGGHHRKGVLRFNALSPRPEALVLRILRPGESEPRVFRWKLN